MSQRFEIADILQYSTANVWAIKGKMIRGRVIPLRAINRSKFQAGAGAGCRCKRLKLLPERITPQ